MNIQYLSNNRQYVAVTTDKNGTILVPINTTLEQLDRYARHPRLMRLVDVEKIQAALTG